MVFLPFFHHYDSDYERHEQGSVSVQQFKIEMENLPTNYEVQEGSASPQPL